MYVKIICLTVHFLMGCACLWEIEMDWLDKPYYSLNAYFKGVYGEKIYKIAVDAGLTCPNRDGTLDIRGCIFCSAGGSGDFAVNISDSPYKKQYEHRGGNTKEISIHTASDAMMKRKILDVKQQITRGMARFNKAVGERFVIYFQAYTNTYASIDYLREIWTAALAEESVVGISIATRPDCLGEDVLCLLKELKDAYHEQGKFIWIELGLQTMYEQTAEYIRRHYSLTVYEEAVCKLAEIDIPYITHVILGLPGETREMMLNTVSYVSDGAFASCEGGERIVCRPFGIKLQLLHVLKDTDLAKDYEAGTFDVLDEEEYISLVAECLQVIHPDVVIHRVTGDGPKKILIAPTWSGNKKHVLNSLHRYMAENNIKQGDKIHRG